jgi:non-homologous end joining protein Ku
MYTATASAPVKATTSITLTAGMLVIPVSLFTGTEETRVVRKEFYNGDPNVPIGRAVVRKDTEAIVHQSDVTRMAQASNGAWVVLTDDEIAASTSPKGIAEILSFIPIKDFGQYLPEKLYQARPKMEKGKVNVAAERAFGILLAGMKARKVGALVKLAMRGPARYAVLTSEGDLIMVLTADAVRQPVSQQVWIATSKAEVAMATSLIDAIGIDTPVLADDTAPVVQAYVDAKAGGKPTKVTPTAPVANDNLIAAFEASIEAAKAAKGKAA